MITDFKNKNLPTSLNILKKILSHLGVERKKQLKTVFILTIFASLAESISIAMLVPFISFFINPDSYLLIVFLKQYLTF